MAEFLVNSLRAEVSKREASFLLNERLACFERKSVDGVRSIFVVGAGDPIGKIEFIDDASSNVDIDLTMKKKIFSFLLSLNS